MRRESFGLLIQYESWRTGEELVITSILNHLHLLFLKFVLELTASGDCVISAQKTTSDSLSEQLEGNASGSCSCPHSFGFLFPENAFVRSVHLHLVDWEQGVYQDTHSPSVAWPARAGQQWVLCWSPHAQASLPIDN